MFKCFNFRYLVPSELCGRRHISKALIVCDLNLDPKRKFRGEHTYELPTYRAAEYKLDIDINFRSSLRNRFR
jgi:hypothetical protein